ncbi:MAG: glycosyltransferase family 4 protein, partial [Flavitalea sp.]
TILLPNIREEFTFVNNVITLQASQIGISSIPSSNVAALPNIVKAAIDTDERQLFSSLIESLSQIESSADWLLASAHCAAANLQLRNNPRLIIDVSFINSVDLRSGIQRVVKNIISEFILSHQSWMPIELIYIQDETMFSACRFAERLFQLKDGCLGNERIVQVKPGDVLFMLDSSLGYFNHFPVIFDQVRWQGGRVLSMVYDLIPALYPETTDENNRNVFIPWLNTILRESDHIICISKSVAEDIINYIRQSGINPNRVLTLSYFHLGSDLNVVASEAKIRPDVDNLLSTDQQNTFITVGTIEPRKGISTILDAFDLLWSKGYAHRLCILGKPGWNVDAIINRIQSHPNIDKLLFFIENPTDAEINACYSFATGLIAASIAEGFGLPLVEAALHKVPTLASDIPPFREIGGEGALFFPVDSSVELANLIVKLCSFTKDERIQMAEKIKIISWKKSTEWLIDIIITGKNYQVLNQ